MKKAVTQKEKQPTLKQRRAIVALVENGGNVSQAMMSAGYTPATAKTPQKLTESLGFEVLSKEYKKELLAVGITAKKLAKKTAEWLDAQKPFSSLTEPDRMVPDYQTQIKAGEMIRKDFKLGEDDDFQEEATFTWRKK